MGGIVSAFLEVLTVESLTTRETRNRTQCEQNNERWLQPPTVLRKLKPLLIELRVSWPLLPGQIQLLLGFFAAVELQMTEAGSHSSKHFCVAPLQGGILPKSLKDHLQIAIGCSAPTLLCFTPPVSIQDHLHSFFLLPPPLRLCPPSNLRRHIWLSSCHRKL